MIAQPAEGEVQLWLGWGDASERSRFVRELGLRVSRRGRFHRPRVVDSDLSLSVSSSGRLFLVAVAGRATVGVDVERIRPIPEADAIVEEFFAPEERRAYFAAGVDARAALFMSMWTQKEAVLKACGAGLSGALDEPVTVTDGPVQCSGGRWWVRTWEPCEGFTAGVALSVPVRSLAHRDSMTRLAGEATTVCCTYTQYIRFQSGIEVQEVRMAGKPAVRRPSAP